MRGKTVSQGRSDRDDSTEPLGIEPRDEMLAEVKPCPYIILPHFVGSSTRGNPSYDAGLKTRYYITFLPSNQ